MRVWRIGVGLYLVGGSFGCRLRGLVQVFLPFRGVIFYSDISCNRSVVVSRVSNGATGTRLFINNGRFLCGARVGPVGGSVGGSDRLFLTVSLCCYLGRTFGCSPR